MRRPGVHVQGVSWINQIFSINNNNLFLMTFVHTFIATLYMVQTLQCHYFRSYLIEGKTQGGRFLRQACLQCSGSATFILQSYFLLL